VEGAPIDRRLAATGAALMMPSARRGGQLAMVGAGMAGGGLWIMLAGGLGIRPASLLTIRAARRA